MARRGFAESLRLAIPQGIALSENRAKRKESKRLEEIRKAQGEALTDLDSFVADNKKPLDVPTDVTPIVPEGSQSGTPTGLPHGQSFIQPKQPAGQVNTATQTGRLPTTRTWDDFLENGASRIVAAGGGIDEVEAFYKHVDSRRQKALGRNAASAAIAFRNGDLATGKRLMEKAYSYMANNVHMKVQTTPNGEVVISTFDETTGKPTMATAMSPDEVAEWLMNQAEIFQDPHAFMSQDRTNRRQLARDEKLHSQELEKIEIRQKREDARAKADRDQRAQEHKDTVAIQQEGNRIDMMRAKGQIAEANELAKFRQDKLRAETELEYEKLEQETDTKFAKEARTRVDNLISKISASEGFGVEQVQRDLIMASPFWSQTKMIRKIKDMKQTPESKTKSLDEIIQQALLETLEELGEAKKQADRQNVKEVTKATGIKSPTETTPSRIDPAIISPQI